MSTLLPLLSSPQSFFPLAAAFVDGFEQAVLVYTSNPRFIVSALAMLLFIVYYLSQVARKPEIIGKEAKFKCFIKDNCPALNQKFWPTCWAFGTHVQTALANAIRNTLPDLQYERQYINCPDGGQVSLDWYMGTGHGTRGTFAASSVSGRRSSFTNHSSETNEPLSYSNRPIAVFIPGLTGDSQTEYIKSLIPHAQACGYLAVAFNNRGRGGMKLKTPKLYNAVDHSDLSLAFETIRSRYPKSTIIATGISLGGILLCRYLTDKRHEAVPDAAVLLSVCFDLQEGAKSMESQGLNLALNRHLAKSLVSIVLEQQEVIKKIPGINYDEVVKANTLRDFDERFTVKAAGYDSSEQYYISASNAKRIGDICVPTLCINAADDMFAPLHSLPIEQISQNACTVMVITHRGGHIGFMEGVLPFLPFYSERLLKQFYQAISTVKNVRKELSSL